MNSNRKLILDIGINDVSYVVTKYKIVSGKRKQVWICPYFLRWRNMLVRCYSGKFQLKNTTYLGCSVCPEWLTFSNFRVWMSSQDWEGKQLDKDILFPGNKVYSPDTCVFVDKGINMFLADSRATRGEHPIGVNITPDGTFTSRCKQGSGKSKHLGTFSTSEEAHEAWRKEKLRLAHILAEQQDDHRVAKALIRRYENYEK